METTLRALILEDSETDCALLVRALRQGGYAVSHKRVDSPAAFAASLVEGAWDVVISDYSMPGFRGTEALAALREKGLDIPFIFVSGTIGEELAVEAMRVGAQDYVMKGNLARLLPAIRREIREASARQEHRRSERRVRQLEKFEALGKLAGGIAHDFNNVIGAIMGWAELGAEDAGPGSKAAKYFQNIRSQAERAAGLTRQLLAYARRQFLEPRNINLNQIINETTTLFRRGIGESIELKLTLASDLLTTHADPSQIEQVLMNLCFNARDAMPKGGVLQIETRNVEIDDTFCKHHAYAKPGSYARLSVADNGTGIDSATMERIFEPFFTTKELGKGTGLGLATAMGVVKQHDGFIGVESEPGHGATFHVYLPVSEGTADPRKAPEDARIRGGSETILIAEDHAGVREMAQEILEGLGYKIILANDGAEAVAKFADNRNEIALVFLDVVMPKMNGPDAYESMTRLRADVPVIFTSGYADEMAQLATLAAKGATLLQKPYAPKDLARKIRERLDAPVLS
jgi:two-component system cell cycle sensor histidine kinase/response regulator CckA